MSSIMNAKSFNASFEATELLTKTLENAAKNLASRCIRECASRHGFDADEEIRVLGLENLSLIKKAMTKKGSKKAKKVVEVKGPKSKIPMPFQASTVKENCCQGLSFNRGLFTQCLKSKMESGIYCEGCQKEGDMNASGMPDAGNVEGRLAVGLYDYKDSKGRSPVSFLKLIEKQKIDMSIITGEAEKQGVEIDPEHFEVVEKQKKTKEMSARGRPKKAVVKAEAEEVSDLFAKLTVDAVEEVEESLEIVSESSSKKSKKMSEEEKAAKKAELEESRLNKKAEREAKIAEEKAAKEAKIAEEKAAKEAKIAEEKAAKEAKIAEEKAAKEAKIAEEKAAKEAKIAEEKAAKEAKRLQEKQEKEAQKAAKDAKIAEEKAAKEAQKATKGKKSGSKEVVAVKPEAAPVAAAAAPTKVSVSRIQIEGVQYLKSTANILYDPTTKEEVGLWNPVTKSIEALPEEDDEEEEEEYEE